MSVNPASLGLDFPVCKMWTKQPQTNGVRIKCDSVCTPLSSVSGNRHVPINIRCHRSRGARPPRKALPALKPAQATVRSTAGHPAVSWQCKETKERPDHRRGTVAPRSYGRKRKPCPDNATAGVHWLSPRSQRPGRWGPSVRPSVTGLSRPVTPGWRGHTGEQTPVQQLAWRGAHGGGVFVFRFFNLSRRTGLREGPGGRGQQTQRPFVHLSELAPSAWQPFGNLWAWAGLTWPRPFKNV